MNFLKRLKVLWKLSAIELTPEQEMKVKLNTGEPVLVPTKKLAQIIKMNDPAKDFIKNEE